MQFFNAQFHQYSHTENNGSFYKTLEYTLPDSIQSFISDISPFATFAYAIPHAPHAALDIEERDTLDPSATPPACNPSAVTSACIRSLYGFNSYKPTTSTGTARIGMWVLSVNIASTDAIS